MPKTRGGNPNPKDGYEICRPTTPVPGETPEQALARYQEAFDHLTECVNAELGVRPESSLLSFLFFKVIVPFAAISAAISTFYSRLVGAAKPHFTYTEHGLAAFHLVLALAVLGLWLKCRKDEKDGRFGRYVRSLQNRFRVAVPPGKESLTRNPIVNRWIFTSLAVGLVFIMPALFYLLRANALEQMGTRFIIDTTGICRPTVGGYNPFEGSDTCKGGGEQYLVRPAVTEASAAIGAVAPPLPIAESPTNLDSDAVDTAEVRLDGTTALALYFFILIAGILVGMAQWWLEERKRTVEQTAEIEAAPGAS